jgi:hypothetical protein
MREDTKTRAGIAALIYTMVNAVVFGCGLVTVLTIPALRADAAIWIPAVVMMSLVLAFPIAWWIAPRLRARYWRRRSAHQTAVTGPAARGI